MSKTGQNCKKINENIIYCRNPPVYKYGIRRKQENIVYLTRALKKTVSEILFDIEIFIKAFKAFIITKNFCNVFVQWLPLVFMDNRNGNLYKSMSPF